MIVLNKQMFPLLGNGRVALITSISIVSRQGILASTVLPFWCILGAALFGQRNAIELTQRFSFILDNLNENK